MGEKVPIDDRNALTGNEEEDKKHRKDRTERKKYDDGFK
jgi:hypothetical protein